MINIGIVCYPTFGGSGVVATELGKALSTKDFRVHFIAYNQPARLDFFNTNIFYHEVSVSKYPLFEYLPYESALTGKMVDIVEHHHLDLIHAHYAVPHATSAIMAKHILKKKGINLPVVTTLHGTDITLVGKDTNLREVVKYSIEESDIVTSVSQSLKNQTYEFFDTKKEIQVIPNFIDFGRFNKNHKEHFRKAIAPNDEFLIAHTSNFRKVKRVDDVLAVFNKICNKIPVKLLMIGDGPERARIEELSREGCGADKVIFLGKTDAVEEVLSVCDLFILPSETESFGLAALEAMACEVPVISTNAGGLPEVNIDGVTGFTANVGDIEKMANGVMELLTNPEKLKTFRSNALKKAKEFELDKILPQYIEMYHRVLR